MSSSLGDGRSFSAVSKECEHMRSSAGDGRRFSAANAILCCIVLLGWEHRKGTLRDTRTPFESLLRKDAR